MLPTPKVLFLEHPHRFVFLEQLKKAIDDIERKAPSGGKEYSLIF